MVSLRLAAPQSRASIVLALPLFAAALVLVCASLLPAGAEAMAPNDDGAANSLGLLAQACASSFCGLGVDALDLWLSLEEVCRTGASNQPSPEGGGEMELGVIHGRGWGTAAAEGGHGGDWSASSTALVCGGVLAVSALVGFRSGIKVGTWTKEGYPVA
ncbi:unnamed protein product [Ectocarpus sp. CCAP 1310/34]|nr:unnamed protein product [Ectocarpus sp. CCAP 1310/34]